MARIGRIAFFIAFLAVVLGAAWLEYEGQRSRADATSAAAQAARVSVDAVLATENAARDYTATRAETASTAYDDARTRLDDARRALRSTIDDPELQSRLLALDRAIDAWQSEVTTTVDGFRAGTDVGSAAALAAARDPRLTEVHAAGDDLARAIDDESRHQRDQAGVRGLLLVAILCGSFAGMNWILFVKTERRAVAERDRQLTFSERLQTATSEESARSMVGRHLEQVVPGAMVLVTDPDDPTPAGRPVASGGQRVATVIIRSDRDLRAPEERLVHDSLLRAGPVLALLRTLSLAQLRAATDPLTGVGNRRLVEDALGRLVAQARRSGDHFAIAVVDLDHFKPINDTYGHAAGDAILQAVAGILNVETREYDVVGRHGGDEFMVVLAGIGAPEAVAVMERCCGAIAALRLGTPAIGVTASIGVAPSGAVLPDDPASLVRAADDAVYVAKARGGDCVVIGTSTEPAPVQGPAQGPAPGPAQASALRA